MSILLVNLQMNSLPDRLKSMMSHLKSSLHVIRQMSNHLNYILMMFVVQMNMKSLIVMERLFHMKSVNHCMMVVKMSMKKNLQIVMEMSNLLVMSLMNRHLMSMKIQMNIHHVHCRVRLMNKKNQIVQMMQSLFLMLNYFVLLVQTALQMTERLL